VRSNDIISLMQRPVFYDYVITGADGFGRGVGYNPEFHRTSFFNAPELDLPTTADRSQAQEQGNYFNAGPNYQAHVILSDRNLNITWALLGAPFDTSQAFDHEIGDDAAVFFDCEIELAGVCHTTLVLAAAGDIGLLDNVVYAGTDTLTGIPAEDETAQLTLVSEGAINILNTWQNGRENSAQGQDIIINAYLIALGESFTFDQQNDVGDDYICDCAPDDRGYIHLYGGLAHRYRGYVHRSNHGGTGYLKDYRWDQRLLEWDVPVFGNTGASFSPEEVDFDVVFIGDTASITLFADFEQTALYRIAESPSAPFTIDAVERYFADGVEIVITFIPEEIESYETSLTLTVDNARYTIPVRGIGELDESAETHPELPTELFLTAFPNPFNASTTIRFEMPEASPVQLELFNVAGQRVASLTDRPYSAGAHEVRFSATELAGGIYFARLQASSRSTTQKLLLLK
jgi:hypothetical protein